MRYRQVHLDFHTSEKIDGIGDNFDAKQFQEMLKVGHVDSITVFSKCHHGWAYHPSKVNEMHPNLKFDLLKAQIEAAHEIGVKTPVYLSVGLDERLARRHPEWLRRMKDEKIAWVSDFMTPGYHEFCLNTPYLDIILAEIAEVVDNYDCDGIFLDIVGVRNCWCQTCVKTLLDKGKDPRDQAAVNELGETVYKNYTDKVREVIHSRKPGLPIFHNSSHVTKGRHDLAYANTHLELESLPTGGWGYDHFPSSARYVETLVPKLEYLGMTGKFHKSWGEFGGFKHPNALKYEVALSIANGARCSIGDQLHPDGHMDERTYELIGSAYAEVEAKEKWCVGSENVADIAVLSEEANKSYLGNPLRRHGNDGDVGASRLLLEGKYLYDIVDMNADISSYKLLIMPDSILVDDKLLEKINSFIENGGLVLASGLSGFSREEAKLIEEGGSLNPRSSFAIKLNCGIDITENCGYSPTYAINKADSNLSPAVVYGKAYKYSLTGEESEYTILADRVNPYFNRDLLHFSSHQHTPYDKNSTDYGIIRHGSIVYCGWEIFSEYAAQGSITTKELVFLMIESLIGNTKTIRTDLGAQGVVTVRKQNNKNRYIIHTLYASPVKRGNGLEIIEDLLPVYGISVKVRVPAPKRVYLAPQNEDIEYAYDNGVLTYTIDKFQCHQMTVIDIK